MDAQEQNYDNLSHESLTLDIETPAVLLHLQKRWACFRGPGKADMAELSEMERSDLCGFYLVY